MWILDQETLQQYLQSMDMTVQELSKKIGISDTHLYSLKNGHVKITKTHLLLKICNELHIDPRELFINT